MVTWRQALTTPAWETTFTVSIGAESTENNVAPGFAVAGLVADTHKSYVQVCDFLCAPVRSFGSKLDTARAWPQLLCAWLFQAANVVIQTDL